MKTMITNIKKANFAIIVLEKRNVSVALGWFENPLNALFTLSLMLLNALDRPDAAGGFCKGGLFNGCWFMI
jgi:hypothetical protein